MPEGRRTDKSSHDPLLKCWAGMLVHCCRDSWSNKLQHARKALFWLHITPRNIAWPLTQTSDLKWDYFTLFSPSTVLNQSWGSNYFFLCFPSLFLTLLSPLHSTSMSHLHYLLAISQRRSIVLCDCIVHPSIPPPFHNLSIVSEMNTPHSLSAHYPHIVILISLSPAFFAECLFNLHFTSPTFLSHRSWEKAFLLTESSLDKKKALDPDIGIRAAQPLHINV